MLTQYACLYHLQGDYHNIYSEGLGNNGYNTPYSVMGQWIGYETVFY